MKIISDWYHQRLGPSQIKIVNVNVAKDLSVFKNMKKKALNFNTEI